MFTESSRVFKSLLYPIYKTFLLITLISVSSSLFADTHTFNAEGGSIFWNNANNWNPVGVPDPSDDVIIPTGKTIQLDQNYSVSTLTLQNGATIEGEYKTLNVSLNFIWTGTIRNCNINVIGDLLLTEVGSRSVADANIEVSGTVNWAVGDLGLGSGSVLTSISAFNIQHIDGLSSGAAPDAILNIQGIMTKSQSSTTTFNCDVQLLAGGSFDLQSGSVVANGGGTYRAQISIGNGATWQFLGGTHNMEAGAQIFGAGSFTNSGATINFNAGSSINSDLSLSGGTINDNVGITVVNVTQSGSSAVFGGTATTSITGTYNWSRGKIISSGSMSVSGVMDINGASTKTLDGSLELTGSGSNWTNGSISISSGAVFKVAPGADFSIAHTSNNKRLSGASDGLFDIQGTVNKTANSITLVNCELSTNNGGALNITTGTVRVTTGSVGNHTGNVNITPGAKFDVENGIHNFNSGSVCNGEGTFLVSNTGLAYFNAGSTMSTNLEIGTDACTGCTFTDNVGTTPTWIKQANGTVTGTGAIACSGPFDWSGGTVSGSNSLTISGLSTFSGTSRTLSGKTLEIVGNGNWTSGDFTFASSSTLKINAASTLQLTHPSAQQASGTGTFYILGTLQKTVSSSITTISVDCMNQGMIEGIGTINFATMDNQQYHSPGISGVGALTVNSFDNNKGALQIEIKGNSGAGIDHDQLVVSGAASLGGNLNVTLLNGFIPNVGDSYQILTSSGLTGGFTENLPVLPPDRQWGSDYSSNQVTLQVLALLPVELSRFDADVIKEKVELKWRTETETNNKGFEVQRSYDGKLWKGISFVNGGGTTNGVRNYKYLDYPKVGTVYYRLRQVDWDGNYDLSNIKSVVVNQDGSFRFAEVHPNPVENKEINVAFPNGLDVVAFYHIADASGRTIENGAIEPGEGYLRTTISARKLNSTGIYYLTVSSGDNQQTIKLQFN